MAYEPAAQELADLRARQAAGEIAADLDPACVFLVLQSTVIAGIIFPGEAKRLLGLDPGSEEYLEHVGSQL